MPTISRMLKLSVPVPTARVLLQFRMRSTAAVTMESSSRPAEWSTAKSYSEIPGPKPLPIIGNLWRFLPVIGEFYNLHIPDFFNNLKKSYGPVVKLTGIMNRPHLIVITNADDAAHVLRNEGPWPIRRGSESLAYYFEHLRKGYPVSLTTSQGKEWQEFRTAVNQVMMQPRNTKQYVEPINQVSQELIDRMREIRGSDSKMPSDFADEISKWALESITYVALDAKLGLLKNMEPNSEAAKMIESVHIMFDSTYKLDFLPSLWKYVSTPDYRRFVASMDYVTEISAKYVNLAMERLKNITASAAGERSYSVLENLLIRSGDPERAVTMALDMLLAGIDTTGAVVTTVMYQIATHPEKQKILQEELDRVIPDPTAPLTKTQLEELKYMRACIKETMRTLPIIFGNQRTTVKDMVVAGYQIPKDTLISFNSMDMLKNEEYFPRPLEFLPERWLPGAENLKCKHPFSFLPFGFGPRMCVGKRFADLEIESAIAKIFRNFTVEWDGPQPASRFYILFRYTDPLTFTVRDRV